MAVITHSLLFTQVSGAAMAAVPELTSEAMAYYRSVGRLGPAMDTGFPVEGWSVLWAWRSDLSPDCRLRWQAEFQVDLVWSWLPTASPAWAPIGTQMWLLQGLPADGKQEEKVPQGTPWRSLASVKGKLRF